MKTKIKENLSELLHAKKSLQANMSITMQVKANLEKVLVFHSKKTEEIKSKIELIHSYHERYPAIFDEISMSEETCRKTLNKLELVINNKEGDICSKYIPLNDQAKQALENNKKTLSVQYVQTSFDPEHEVELIPSNVQHLEVESELLNTAEPDNISFTEQIAILGEHVLLITKIKPAHVVSMDVGGNIVAKYYPKCKDEVVYGVNVYRNNIYIVQNSEISITSAYPQCLRFMAVKIKNSSKIGIISKSELIIPDPEDGTVCVYNTRSDKSEIVVKGLNNPQCVSIARTCRGVFYIITERTRAVNDAFKIYDNDWNLYSNINGNFPGQTAATDRETILVAEEGYFSVSHRISHFTLEGVLLSHIIVYSNLFPKGLAYCYPYMCSCDNLGCWVKCHKMTKKDEPLLSAIMT